MKKFLFAICLSLPIAGTAFAHGGPHHAGPGHFAPEMHRPAPHHAPGFGPGFRPNGPAFRHHHRGPGFFAPPPPPPARHHAPRPEHRPVISITLPGIVIR